ncbi:hypothetical protein [Robertmurraya andreesenii]|uniref:Uncharacterized protein n=1 Tax=Anoxybacillus andreesenii TaxID=1325932 RepID=A0ABT9UZZ8_9BACL|nr:hypothetical protein [Robertmurraya andreesenii]MDQ0154270.1 hypothetical protein [Robertmurraya andreesenii]
MSEPISREKSFEILLERLIMMVGKSNERHEHLYNRVLQLERILLEESSENLREKKSFIS